MHPDDLREDLKSEVILILLEQPPGRIEKLHQDKKLIFFAIRIIINTIQSKTSNFSKTFRISTTDFIPEIQSEEIATRQAQENKEEGVYQILLKLKPLAYQRHPNYIDGLGLTWYQQYMLSLYMKFGSYREIERETRIPYHSCFLTIKETINKLKKYVKP